MMRRQPEQLGAGYLGGDAQAKDLVVVSTGWRSSWLTRRASVLEQPILKRPLLLPAVGTEIALIGAEDAPVAEVFG